MATEKTGFQIACELSDFGAAMVESTFIRNNPDSPEAEVEEAVRAWRSDRPGAEHGDAPGRLRKIDYLL